MYYDIIVHITDLCIRNMYYIQYYEHIINAEYRMTGNQTIKSYRLYGAFRSR